MASGGVSLVLAGALVCMVGVAGAPLLAKPQGIGIQKAHASTATKAKKAFKKKAKSIYNTAVAEDPNLSPTVEYLLVDINKDGVVEMLVRKHAPGPSFFVYAYRSGKAKQIFSNMTYSGGQVTKLYKRTGAFLHESHGRGIHSATIYTWNGKTCKVRASVYRKADSGAYLSSSSERKVYDKAKKKYLKGSAVKVAKKKWTTIG